MASSSTETPAKRKRSEQSDDTDPNSTASSESRGSTEGKIPIDISDWKEEHIQSLSVVVQYEENTTPYALIKNLHDSEDHEDIIPEKNRKAFYEKKDLLKKFMKFFIREVAFHLLNDDFASLSRERAEALQEREIFSTKPFLQRHLKKEERESNLGYIDDWCNRFEAAGVRFAQCLYCTVVRRDLDIIDDDGDKARKQPLTEYDFQFLFEAFTSIFNLNSFNWMAPLLRCKTLKLSQSKPAGKTDIIYHQQVGAEMDMPLCRMRNIVAICEVKKHYKEPQQLDPVVTRNHSSSSTQKSLPPHMSLAEIGQFGGKLLLYSQQSFTKDVIFGIFVQETKVSFAALKITPAEYSGILSGKLEKTNPKLIITRPFDYMKMEDRKHLIRPLLYLSLIQEQKVDKMWYTSWNL